MITIMSLFGGMFVGLSAAFLVINQAIETSSDKLLTMVIAMIIATGALTVVTGLIILATAQ